MSKTHPDEWNIIINKFSYLPTPLKTQYLKLHETYGDGTAEAVFYESKYGMVYYSFLIRRIKNSRFVDITTPYGYGGPVFTGINHKNNLILAFEFIKEFDKYCLDVGVVSEFIRYTPHLKNHIPLMENGFPVVKHCNNVVIDLKKNWEEINKNIRYSYLSQIRKNENLGKLKFSFASGNNATKTFYELYSKNMEYKKIKGYFNFRKLYIELLANKINNDILISQVKYQEKIINSAIFLLSRPYFIDYFLAASAIDFKQAMGSHYLIYKTIEWAKNSGFIKMQLGGGHSSLIFFKSGFSKEVDEYFVSKIIRNTYEYERLVELNSKRLNSTFPAYR